MPSSSRVALSRRRPDRVTARADSSASASTSASCRHRARPLRPWRARSPSPASPARGPAPGRAPTCRGCGPSSPTAHGTSMMSSVVEDGDVAVVAHVERDDRARVVDDRADGIEARCGRSRTAPPTAMAVRRGCPDSSCMYDADRVRQIALVDLHRIRRAGPRGRRRGDRSDWLTTCAAARAGRADVRERALRERCSSRDTRSAAAAARAGRPASNSGGGRCAPSSVAIVPQRCEQRLALATDLAQPAEMIEAEVVERARRRPAGRARARSRRTSRSACRRCR